MVSATAVSLTQTDITYALGNSGTDIVAASVATGIYLAIDGFVNVLAVSDAVRTGALKVRATHASTGGQPYVINQAMALAEADMTNIVRDNSALALPVTPATTAINVTAFRVPLAIDYDPMVAAQNVPGYSIKPKTVGGNGNPITSSVASGAIPAGTTLNANTGEIAGGATTVGRATFTIKAVQVGSADAIKPSKTIKTTATVSYSTYTTAVGTAASAYAPEIGTALTGVSGGTSVISNRVRNTTQGTVLHGGCAK